ncbi:sensor histidine kinase [Desulfocurvus sp. DL9XJH121]
MTNKIRSRIIVYFAFIPLVPFALTLCVGLYYFIYTLETNSMKDMRRIAVDHKRMIESFLVERRSDLQYALRTIPIDDLIRPGGMPRALSDLQEKSASYVDLGLFDAHGLHVAYEGEYELQGRRYDQEPWFEAVMERGEYVSDVFLGHRGVPHFTISVAEAGQGPRHVLRATLDSNRFGELVRNVRIGKTGESYIINSQGLFQTRRRSGGELMEKDADTAVYEGGGGGEGDKARSFVAKGADGEDYLFATTSLNNGAWTLVVRQEKNEAFASLYMSAYIIVLISVVGGAAVLVLAVLLSGRIDHTLQSAHSDKERLGQQLVRATRLAEIGQMATGIAHEINNPLQVMKSDLALIDFNVAAMNEAGTLKPCTESDELKESIAQIKKQIERCAKITRAILDFGRFKEPAKSDVDLRDFITDVVSMVRRKAEVNGIKVEEVVAGDSPFIRVDASQLQQVLLNLLNNAVDAIVERHGSSGGELSVLVERNVGHGVRLVVRDNGPGMDKDRMHMIFTPFFTTKPVGKGTGLGLFVCQGIVEGMGGTLEVESAKGEGTAFIVTLPPAKVVEKASA